MRVIHLISSACCAEHATQSTERTTRLNDDQTIRLKKRDRPADTERSFISFVENCVNSRIDPAENDQYFHLSPL